MDRGAPAGPARHRRARLRREQGADRALARPGAPALRDLAALRAHLERGPARGGGRARARASGLLRADPSRPRITRRSRTVRRLFPGGRELYRRLRPLRPARPALDLRPLHPPRRGGARRLLGRAARSRRSARPRTCSWARACSISQALRDPARRAGRASRPTSAAAPATRCCAPRPRATRCCSCAARPGRRSTRSTR